MTDPSNTPEHAELARIRHVLSLHGCTGDDIAIWLARVLNDASANKLGIAVWTEYMRDVDKMLEAYGFEHGQLRITWIKEQLENLARLRRGEPDGYKATDRNFRCAPDETDNTPCTTN